MMSSNHIKILSLLVITSANEIAVYRKSFSKQAKGK